MLPREQLPERGRQPFTKIGDGPGLARHTKREIAQTIFENLRWSVLRKETLPERGRQPFSNKLAMALAWQDTRNEKSRKHTTHISVYKKEKETLNPNRD